MKKSLLLLVACCLSYGAKFKVRVMPPRGEAKEYFVNSGSNDIPTEEIRWKCVAKQTDKEQATLKCTKGEDAVSVEASCFKGEHSFKPPSFLTLSESEKIFNFKLVCAE